MSVAKCGIGFPGFRPAARGFIRLARNTWVRYPIYERGGSRMPTNRKRLVVPTSMGAGGFEVLKTRDDGEGIPFPPMISSPDFNALLRADGEVNGAILGLTRFGETEAQNAKGLQVVSRIGVGYDAVDVPALTRHKVPLMVAGTAHSPSVAEQAMHFMFALAKRGAELNALVKANRWGDRFKTLPIDLIGKTLLIVGFGRIGTRVARRCLAMEMTVLVYDPYVPAAAIRAAGCEPVANLDLALPRGRDRAAEGKTPACW